NGRERSAAGRGGTMHPDELRAVLEAIQGRQLSVEAGLERLRAAVAGLGDGPVGLGRRDRCGFSGGSFFEGEAGAWGGGVGRWRGEAKEDCLATRVSPEQAEWLARQFPQAQQDRVARTFWLPAGPPGPRVGRTLIVTAGTSDLPVAREALVTAEAMGCDA